MKRKLSNNKIVFLLIIPALIISIIVHVIPIISTIYISFINLDMYNFHKFFFAPFAGFKNFINIFTSKLEIGNEFLISFRNIIFFGIIVIPVSLVIAFLVSLFLNQKFPGKAITIAVILIPYFTMDSVCYGLWSSFFDNSFGIINKFLFDIKILDKPIYWNYGSYGYVPIIIATIWKSWSFYCMLIYAGLQGIPKEIYEASMIDGASHFRQTIKITIPLLSPIIITITILSVIWTINSYNNFIIMFGSWLNRSTIVPSTALVKQLTVSFNYGIASAMAVILILIILILILVVLLKKKDENL